jgi:hypothetical protein
MNLPETLNHKLAELHQARHWITQFEGRYWRLVIDFQGNPVLICAMVSYDDASLAIQGVSIHQFRPQTVDVSVLTETTEFEVTTLEHHGVDLATFRVALHLKGEEYSEYHYPLNDDPDLTHVA